MPLTTAPAPASRSISADHPTPNPSPGPAPTAPTQAQSEAGGGNVILDALGFGPAGAGTDILNGAKAVVTAPINAAKDAVQSVSDGFASFGNGILKVGSDLVTVLIVLVLFALGIFLIFHEQTFPLAKAALDTAKKGAKTAAVAAV